MSMYTSASFPRGVLDHHMDGSSAIHLPHSILLPPMNTPLLYPMPSVQLNTYLHLWPPTCTDRSKAEEEMIYAKAYGEQRVRGVEIHGSLACSACPRLHFSNACAVCTSTYVPRLCTFIP